MLWTAFIVHHVVESICELPVRGGPLEGHVGGSAPGHHHHHHHHHIITTTIITPIMTKLVTCQVVESICNVFCPGEKMELLDALANIHRTYRERYYKTQVEEGRLWVLCPMTLLTHCTDLVRMWAWC
jgi:hypothetical protein